MRPRPRGESLSTNRSCPTPSSSSVQRLLHEPGDRVGSRGSHRSSGRGGNSRGDGRQVARWIEKRVVRKEKSCAGEKITAPLRATTLAPYARSRFRIEIGPGTF